MVLADAIVLEAALSFIGVGIRPLEPSWGNVMSEGRAFISSGQWWITTARAGTGRLRRRYAAAQLAQRRAAQESLSDDVATGGRGLSVGFPEVYGDVAVLDQISFAVAPGETVGLVGESGCGKSLLGLSIMGLEPRGARVESSVAAGVAATCAAVMDASIAPSWAATWR